MSFSCGIVGLPNVGKSTLFNALTRAGVAASNYPFCTIDANVGIIPVPDPRLARLTELVPTAHVTLTTIRFVDIAGLVKGASHGDGLGNQFLSRIAEVEAIVHVVRCFEDTQVVHVDGQVDPARDIEIIHTELALKDLDSVRAAVHRVGKMARADDAEAKATLALLERVQAALDQGQAVRTLMAQCSSQDLARLRPMNLLTAKPVVYLANVAEQDAAHDDAPAIQPVRAAAAAAGAPVIPICAAIESDIAQFDTEEERVEYLRTSGLQASGLDRLIGAGYAALSLITFYTLGPTENRAWTVRVGAAAPEAAGKIHSDMARGFIRAEVIGYEDFLACGSEAACRDRGKLRVEGKEYLVRDGDIMHFRFNV